MYYSNNKYILLYTTIFKYSIKIIHTSTFCPWTNFFKFVFLFNIIIHGKSLCTIFSNISIILIHFNKYICIEHVILCSIIRLISTYYYILKLYKYAIKILYTLSINGVINGLNTDITLIIAYTRTNSYYIKRVSILQRGMKALLLVGKVAKITFRQCQTEDLRSAR